MKISFFLCLFFLIQFASAQQVTISGYVRDKDNGENLIGASIIDAASGKGVVSNNYGFYSLSVTKSDTINITVSYIGYKKQNKVLPHLNINKTIHFNLVSDEILPEVQVRGIDIQRQTEMSTVRIPLTQVKLLPAIGGETDIMKALQLMPGIQSGNEGSSGLYVRGGSPDQNLILLDDVPLYYVNHLGGFVSVFNTDAINNVKLIKGGFPARYGSRLSSVMDIRMKDGNLNKFQTQGSVGIISSKISVEGPLIKDKTSFIVSARRFMLDLISRPVSKVMLDGISSGYTFYDVNVKLNHKFSTKDRLYFSFYKGDDKINTKKNDKEDVGKENIKNQLKWGNMLTAIRWNKQYNSKLFSNVTLTHTRYRYLSEFETFVRENLSKTEEYYNAFKSNINDLSMKIDFEYYRNSDFRIKFGTNSTYHIFTPGIASYKRKEVDHATIDTSFNNQKINALENAIYVENIFDLWNRIKVNSGLRACSYQIEGKNFYSFEPRILLNYMAGDNFSIKSSFASMQQNVHLLSYSGIGLPTDLWVPATIQAPPEKSIQYAIGLEHYRGLYEIGIEGYYKNLTNLISFSEGASFIGNAKNWQEKIETGGKGKSYGLEFLVQKKVGKLTGWVAYTLSKTERTFKNLNKGKVFPYRYDRRHDISIVLNHRFSKKLTLSATWVYGTGNAVTLPVAYYNTIDYKYDELENKIEHTTVSEVEIYKTKNNFRMRSFHKLDIGINLKKIKKRGERIWNFSIYNVYNRKNPYYYYFDDVQVTGHKKLYQKSLFPIIPSISYNFNF